MTLLAGKEIPLEAVEQERIFALLDFKPIFEYDQNNRRTETVAGYAYIVANTDSFEKYRIKIMHKNALLSEEALRARRDAGERIYVEFEDAMLKMYWSKDKNSYEDTLSASDISFVETEN